MVFLSKNDNSWIIVLKFAVKKSGRNEEESILLFNVRFLCRRSC